MFSVLRSKNRFSVTPPHSFCVCLINRSSMHVQTELTWPCVSAPSTSPNLSHTGNALSFLSSPDNDNAVRDKGL